MKRYLCEKMERCSNQSIKTKNWYGTVVLRNSYAKKQMINDINNDVKRMLYFLNFYILAYESNVDIVFFATYQGLTSDELLAMCKYLYDMHGYLAFSSTTRLNRFLRKTNQITVERYERKLYFLARYYISALLNCLFILLILMLAQYLMTL